ncbi:cell wall hydrolase [Lachnospiraceae bacterium ZAX-1]
MKKTIDYNKKTVAELVSIYKKFKITFEINDGRIVTHLPPVKKRLKRGLFFACAIASLAPMGANASHITAGVSADIFAEPEERIVFVPYEGTVPDALPAAKEEPYALTGKEQALLLQLAISEAENQDTLGMALVMQTVLNRVESDRFPDSVADVIFQKSQFYTSPKKFWDAKNSPKYPQAVQALTMVLNGSVARDYPFYLFFVSKQCDTVFTDNLTHVFDYGNHRFYAY